MNWFEILGVVFGIAILSFPFKINPIYRLVESLYIGASAGYILTTNFNRAYIEGILQIPSNPMLVIPIILGLLMYTRLSKKYNWISRYPISFLIALGIGVSTRAMIEAEILSQIRSSALPLIISTNGNLDVIAILSNIIIIISVPTVITYFIYTREQKGILGISSKIGMGFMMIGFGTAVATSFLSRISKTIGLLQGLIMVPSGTYMVPIMIVIMVISIYLEKKSIE